MKEFIIRNVVRGAIFTGMVEIATRADKAFNPQVYELFKVSTRWYQYLTSPHSFTVAYLEHDPISALLILAITSTAAAIVADRAINKK